MWMRNMLCSSALVAPLLSFPVLAQMPRIELSAGMYRIDAEVAANDATRMQGLMNRRSLPASQGMLFVFRQPDRHCMWMRNTHVPLSVAFLDRDGYILNIEDMQPESETSHCAARAASFALEMNLGWFADKGIRPGARIAGIEKSPAPR
jgi:hypothetical protein